MWTNQETNTVQSVTCECQRKPFQVTYPGLPLASKIEHYAIIFNSFLIFYFFTCGPQCRRAGPENFSK